MSPQLPAANETVRLSAIGAWAVLFMATLAVLAGCGQLERESRADRLDKSVRLYASSIRWGNFDTAATLTRVRQGEQPPLDDSALRNIRVTAYSSRVLDLDETAGEARMTANFDYYFLDSGTVRNVSQTAVWYFDETAERWFLDGSLPNFRR